MGKELIEQCEREKEINLSIVLNDFDPMKVQNNREKSKHSYSF